MTKWNNWADDAAVVVAAVGAVGAVVDGSAAADTVFPRKNSHVYSVLCDDAANTAGCDVEEHIRNCRISEI